MQKHPDILLAPHREPHKKFIEQAISDLLVHECVPAYKLWEVRLASETIATSSTFSRNANDPLKISEEEVSPSVDAEEGAINKITALFVAMEYLGVIVYSLLKYNEGTLSEVHCFTSGNWTSDVVRPRAFSTYS